MPAPNAKHCPVCGGGLPAGTLHGLCAACLWGAMDHPRLDEEDDSVPLLRLPGLNLMEVMNRGGMGIVYRARDTDGGRMVAVKMLLTRHEDDPEMLMRFRQEADAVCGMNHPGILPVYRVGEHEGQPFFSMKLAEGGALSDRIAEYSGAWRRIAQLMTSLADAIHYAHSRGVLHRDVKPANILFDAAGAAYVSDFGLVKLVDSGSSLTRSVNLMGTPHYMAPEVAAQNMRSATVASDVWSLGAVMYELLARQRPFDAPGIPALLRRIVDERPPPMPDTLRPPRDLTCIAFKCLEKEPAHRYASAAALRDDLEAWLQGRPIAARPPSRLKAARLWMRRNKALTVVSLLSVAALAAGAWALAAKNRTLSRSLSQEQFSRAVALRGSGDIRQRDEALALLATAVRGGADAAAARDEAITLLATPGWKELRRIPWNPNDNHVPVLPDFSRLMKVDKGVLRLLPLEHGGDVEVISSPEPVRDVIAAGGDKLLVTTGEDDAAMTRLYDRSQRRWLREWRGEGQVSLCPQGRLIAYATQDHTQIVIEDLTGAVAARTVRPSIPRPRAGPFTADGRRLAILSNASGAVEVADVEKGTFIALVDNPRLGNFDPTVAWSPNGMQLTVAADVPHFRLWQIEEGNCWCRLGVAHLTELFHVAWHPSGSWLATTSQDGTLRLWDTSSTREIFSIRDRPVLVFFSTGGDRMLYTRSDTGELVVCALTPPQVVRSVELPHSNPDLHIQRGPWGAALTPDGRTAIIAGDDTWLVDTASGRAVSTLATGFMQDVLVMPDSSRFFLAGANSISSAALTRDAPGGWTAGPLETLTTGHGAYRMSWSAATTTLAATSGGGNVWLYRPGTSNSPVRQFETGQPVNPVAISPDGRWMVAGPGIGRKGVRVFDLRSPGNTPCTEFDLGADSYFIFSADSRALYITAGRSFIARETGTWAPLWSQPAAESGVVFNRLAISGDGELLAISLFPQAVQLRRSRDGELLATLRPPDSRFIAWLALDEKGTRLVTSAPGHIIHMWDLIALRASLQRLGLGFQEN